METLQDRLQREAREKLRPEVTNIDPRFDVARDFAEELLNVFWVEQQKDLDAIISHTISETIKAGVSVIEGEKKEDYCYDEKNEAHNDFEESLDYLETKGEAHEEGFNQALQTAVTKLQELQDKK